MNLVVYPSNFNSLRKTFGQGLVKLGDKYSDLVVLDAEVGNSTFTELFAQEYPQRFIQGFVAEQNMLSMALGLSIRGKIPFVSTFAAFLMRSADQIRMVQYSNADLKIAGTHCGVSIGEDGPSQMALEDISFFRSILDSVVLYPSDSVALVKLLDLQLSTKGISYIRITRGDLPVIYSSDETFKIGGSKVVFGSQNDQVGIIACGVTLHESIKAAINLQEQGINVRVVDLYSIKPLDKKMLESLIHNCKSLVVVEDHFMQGGVYSAVVEELAPLSNKIPVHSLSVSKTPRSGKPEELLKYENIDANAIINKVKSLTLV
jgi:transketolase